MLKRCKKAFIIRPKFAVVHQFLKPYLAANELLKDRCQIISFCLIVGLTITYVNSSKKLSHILIFEHMHILLGLFWLAFFGKDQFTGFCIDSLS